MYIIVIFIFIYFECFGRAVVNAECFLGGGGGHIFASITTNRALRMSHI